MRLLNLLLGKNFLVRRRLIREYLTDEEQVKMTLYTLLCILAPFVFTYIFLVINDGLIAFGTRAFYYIPLILVMVFSLKKRYQINRNFLSVALSREKEQQKKLEVSGE